MAKSVTIYSTGKCNPETRLGTYDILLEYNEHRKHLCKTMPDTTANRCIIQGLIDGVSLLKQPCDVTLVTTTKIGIAKLGKNKGPNIDLLKELVALLAKKDCTFEFKERTGEGEKINKKISTFADAC